MWQFFSSHFENLIATFSHLFDNFRCFKTTLFIQCFPLFAMQYKFCLGHYKMLLPSLGCVCVKAIPRTALLLSKTSENKVNCLHFSGLQFKVLRSRTFAFCESCTKLILAFSTIDDWQICFALDVRKLGVVICFAPTGSPASGKIVIKVSISGLSICSKSLSKQRF